MQLEGEGAEVVHQRVVWVLQMLPNLPEQVRQVDDAMLDVLEPDRDI